MAPRLIEAELRVVDVDRSLRFYRDLVGIQLGDPETDTGQSERHSHAVWGSWGEGEDFLMLNVYPATRGETTRGHVGFAVDDLDAVHARLTAAGAVVVHGPEPRPWGRTAVYRDPDGNTVSLTSRS